VGAAAVIHRLLLALALLALPAAAFAQAAKVQDGENTANFSGDGIDSRSFGGAVTVGNVVVCATWVGANDRDVTSITDTSGSNTWSEIVARDNVPSGDEATIEIWATTVVGAFTTLTVNLSSAFGGGARIDCYEVSGITTTSATSNNAQNSATTNHTPGNVTITGSGFLVGVTAGSGGAYTADGSWNSEASHANGITVTRLPTAGTYTFTNTTSANENTISIIAGFNQSGGGGGGSTPRLLMLGVGN
jgi:hypothetical protein